MNRTVVVFRLLFSGLIAFELLNFLEILHFTLDFSWFGLVITDLFIWGAIEGVAYATKDKNFLAYGIIAGFAGAMIDVSGDIFHLYSRYGFYDQTAHIIGGAFTAYLIFILFKNIKSFSSSRLLFSLFIISFTSLFGVLYELEEYFEDILVHRRALRLGDGQDTANDLFLNLAGAALVVIIWNIKKPYHFVLAFLGALIYGFPSKKLKVIGVTGTKGKTTTCFLIYQILQAAGLKTGLATTVNFAIGSKIWPNDTKQTMLGRFRLQKLLSQMVKDKCLYAVIETSSEGILQYREKFIDYSVAVFSNLSPEHLERHGGFENYRSAKIKFFRETAKKKSAFGIYNLDDENIKYFLEAGPKNSYGFAFYKDAKTFPHPLTRRFQISKAQITSDGTAFEMEGDRFETPLIGEFNMYNAVSAICTAFSQNIPREIIKKAMRSASAPPGRMELIQKEPFRVFIDYSYESKSLEEALKTIELFHPARIIVLIGSAGGGRDRWRRPVMGETADSLADIIVVTTDDPYDENPETIVDEILPGILKNKERTLGKNVFRVVDRQQAIKKAIGLAGKGDVVLLAGKGGEMWMNIGGGKKIPWNERETVEEILKERS